MILVFLIRNEEISTSYFLNLQVGGHEKQVELLKKELSTSQKKIADLSDEVII